jgi:hypothetical protein
MKTKSIIILLLIFGSIYTQDDATNFDFTTSIEVEKEEPRVSITASRKLPVFPELPISRDYMDDILNRFDNKTYYIERRKVVILANIEQELINFN